jgi:hypothetical protein
MKRGERGIENKGNGGNGYPSGICAGPSLLIWSDPSSFMSFMLIFLDANIKSVLPFYSLVTIPAMWVPTWICSPSGYLSSHQYIPLDLPPSGYP